MVGIAAAGPVLVGDLAWYRGRAESGDAQAQVELAQRYAKGIGVVKDLKQAAEWYRKAAEQGHAGAMNKVAWAYADGIAGGIDWEQALPWFSKAAELDDGNSLRQLAVMYGQGIHVEQDRDRAMQYLVQLTRWGEAGVHHLDLGSCGIADGMAATIALRLHDDVTIRMMSLSEQSLVRTYIKRRHSPSDMTGHCMLELQLCLSRLNDQCIAVATGH